MEHLIHLIYASRSHVNWSRDDLDHLLTHSRENNERCGVTGMLLFVEGSFFQVLEGPAREVDARYGRIIGDPRHHGIVTIIRERIAVRAFGDWSMGFAEASAMEVANAAGMNDFFVGASCLEALDRGRAKRLLHAFSEGSWRIGTERSGAGVAHA